MNIIKIPRSRIKNNTYNRIIVPKEICSIAFDKDKCCRTLNVNELDSFTNRGDLMFIHLNKKGEVMEIELVCGKQPCQKS